MQKIIFYFLFLLGNISIVHSQQDWRFSEDIQEFKKQDSLSFPEPGGILFVGSSSIRRWTDLKKRFEEYSVIQRGFGGSEYNEVLYYADDIIFPYKPAKIMFYAGENDVDRGRSVDEIYETFLTLYDKVRNELPNTEIFVISVKPSEKLKAHRKSIQEINERLRNFAKLNPDHIQYIDIYHAMLDEKGDPNLELYVEDKIHLTASGYDIWEKIIRKYL